MELQLHGAHTAKHGRSCDACDVELKPGEPHYAIFDEEMPADTQWCTECVTDEIVIALAI